jgi:ferredoxin
MSDLTLAIDTTRCQGHAICYLVAPELFEVDEEGRGSVIDANVPPALEEKARVAAQRCPERAVSADQA